MPQTKQILGFFDQQYLGKTKYCKNTLVKQIAKAGFYIFSVRIMPLKLPEKNTSPNFDFLSIFGPFSARGLKIAY